MSRKKNWLRPLKRRGVIDLSEASGDVVIEASELTKSYGEILAVDHINFEVKKGEVFGFLGPNGAGKTTTIRMVTGLSKPTAGKASVLGFDINSRIVEAKKHIGVVPEISNLYDELSGIENLLFMAQLYGVPRAERRKRAEELLKTFYVLLYTWVTTARVDQRILIHRCYNIP